MKIGTHNGQFHADEVLAIAALRLLDPDAEVVRTRDPKVLESCDIVVDVGGEYDEGRRRYDHHQRGKAGARASKVEYSSAGLIWRHYGVEVCAALGAGDLAEDVAAAVDEMFVAFVDATDNGQKVFGEALYNIGVPTVSSLISSLNANWFEQASDGEAFDHAVEIMGVFLARSIRSAFGFLSAKGIVLEAVRSERNGIVLLDRFVPWQQYVSEASETAQFVVFPSTTPGEWMVQTVPVEPGSFQSRVLFPESWGGLRDEKLAESTGVEDVIFVHPGRFIGGARSMDGALELATKARRAAGLSGVRKGK